MRFKEYLINEVLDMKKDCPIDMKIINDDDKMVKVKFDNGILLEIIFRTASISVDFEHETSKYQLLNTHEYSKFTEIFDAIYCICKRRDFDPNYIDFTIAGDVNDTIIPKDVGWYDHVNYYLTKYNFDDSELKTKISNKEKITQSQYVKLHKFISHQLEDGDGDLVNNNNVNIISRRANMYKSILTKNFKNIDIEHITSGVTHRFILNGSFING